MVLKKLCDIKVGRTLYRGQSYNDILSMLSSGVLSFDSLASEVDKNQWSDLLKFNDLAPYLTSKLMLASNGYSHESLFNHWYVKDGERSFGPFSLLQMLEFFQQQRLHLDSLVRHSSGEGWSVFSDSGPFATKSLKQLLSCAEIKKIITRRKQPRIRYDNEVFLSAAAELYRGITWSLSSQGLGLVTDQSTQLNLNNRVNIIINSNNEHGAVQVKGRVVNIKKEINYERVAIELDEENEFLNQFIDQRIPRL